MLSKEEERGYTGNDPNIVKCKRCKKRWWEIDGKVSPFTGLCVECMSKPVRNEDDVLKDNVSHPPHYTHGPIEVVDLIEGFHLGYYRGAIAKYLFRCKHKGKCVEDLEKASWYLRRLVDRLKDGTLKESEI